MARRRATRVLRLLYQGLLTCSHVLQMLVLEELSRRADSDTSAVGRLRGEELGKRRRRLLVRGPPGSGQAGVAVVWLDRLSDSA